MIVDIHAHLDFPSMQERLDEILIRAKEAGVKAIYTSGINRHTNRVALAMAEKYDIIQPSLGMYPLEPLKHEIEMDGMDVPNDPFDVDEEIKFIRKQKPPLIGEIGMDRAFITDKDKEQEETFSKMIRLAMKIKKPMLIHTRKAEEQCIDILESESAKRVIMHCFTGKKKLLKRIADNGWYCSIPPIIVRSQQFQILAEEMPIGQLLTETDSPYLSPYKDKENEPAFITSTILKIAEVKQLDPAETEKMLYMNYLNII
ncbi:TatD family hydrolase [Candidatus Woesearchaeota archaeon]|nr:TatD family hydrolase [Candidatus Woesearchaeota archaeon]